MQLHAAEARLAQQERQTREYLSAAREALALAEEAKKKASALEARLKQKPPLGNAFKPWPLPAKTAAKRPPAQPDPARTEATRAQKVSFICQSQELAGGITLHSAGCSCQDVASL